MPKVDEPPRYRVKKWSIKDCYAEDIEKWMNEVNRDYVLDQIIQQGDDIVMILRYWKRLRRRAPLTTKIPKKKAVKKVTPTK